MNFKITKIEGENISDGVFKVFYEAKYYGFNRCRKSKLFF